MKNPITSFIPALDPDIVEIQSVVGDLNSIEIQSHVGATLRYFKFRGTSNDIRSFYLSLKREVEHSGILREGE